jgi:hypothetical protein
MGLMSDREVLRPEGRRIWTSTADSIGISTRFRCRLRVRLFCCASFPYSTV